jgi:outer membrane lipoprotein-sorting protein
MMRRSNFMMLVLFCWFSTFHAEAQKKQQEPSGSTVLQNVSKGTEGVRDYVATIEAKVDMERLRVPKMNATLYFKKPDKVHFDAPGFAMLPREGIVMNAGTLRSRYDAETVGIDEKEGKTLLKLKLTGKMPNIRPSELLLWVDQSSWTIARMESTPYQGRVLKLEFTYETLAGGFVLPKTLKATFDAGARDSTQRPLDVDLPNVPQVGDLNQRAPRSGSITVNYLDYKINVGLSDELFEKKENPPKGR